jgi:hypothetical protein
MATTTAVSETTARKSVRVLGNPDTIKVNRKANTVTLTLSIEDVLELVEASVSHNNSYRVKMDTKESKEFHAVRTEWRKAQGKDAPTRVKMGKVILFGGKAKERKNEGWTAQELLERSLRIDSLSKRLRKIAQALAE